MIFIEHLLHIWNISFIGSYNSFKEVHNYLSNLLDMLRINHIIKQHKKTSQMVGKKKSHSILHYILKFLVIIKNVLIIYFKISMDAMCLFKRNHMTIVQEQEPYLQIEQKQLTFSSTCGITLSVLFEKPKNVWNIFGFDDINSILKIYLIFGVFMIL